MVRDSRPVPIPFSPKAFLPLTNLCRDRCGYCAFRRDPEDPGAWTMAPVEVVAALDRAAAAGCIEALFCLGDTPETAFPAYRALLASWGFGSTVDYLVQAGLWALERGLLPHTNAGVLSRRDMERLRPVNLSLGLMLEVDAPRLAGPGGPHHRAPDKRPRRRLAMIDAAGELRIPFTSGVLVGFGETRDERAAALDALAASHARHGHLQECIVQPFRAHPGTPMARHPDADIELLADAVAMARQRLPREVAVQAPPNLVPGALPRLLECGVGDLGGISPVTTDYINPGWAWPHLEELAVTCEAVGRRLDPRLPAHDRYLGAPGWVDEGLLPAVARARDVQEAWRARIAGWLARSPGTQVPRLPLFHQSGGDHATAG